jgi:hypothetical protein
MPVVSDIATVVPMAAPVRLAINGNAVRLQHAIGASSRIVSLPILTPPDA